jgi:hypothetical protein
MDPEKLIAQALKQAASEQYGGLLGGSLHRERSSRWIEALADAFRAQYADDPSIRVFSRHNEANKDDFLLNELLYDVSVCRVDEVRSAVQKRLLAYVREALWQVESEFAKNSRETLKDFNKLVCGSARCKLFVGSQVNDNGSFVDVLLPAALACSGEVYVALLPHPKEWGSPPLKVLTWRLADGAWEPVGPGIKVWWKAEG